jgi:hypothetical protein
MQYFWVPGFLLKRKQQLVEKHVLPLQMTPSHYNVFTLLLVLHFSRLFSVQQIKWDVLTACFYNRDQSIVPNLSRLEVPWSSLWVFEEQTARTAV